MRELDAPIRGLKPMMLAATAVALTLAVLGASLRGTLGTVAAGSSVAVIIAVPLLRVVVLGAHWWRAGDRRFAGLAAALLAVVASGAIIAFI